MVIAPAYAKDQSEVDEDLKPVRDLGTMNKGEPPLKDLEIHYTREVCDKLPNPFLKSEEAEYLKAAEATGFKPKKNHPGWEITCLRTKETLVKLLELLANTNKGDCVVMVGHGATTSAMVDILTGTAPKTTATTGAFYELELTNQEACTTAESTLGKWQLTAPLGMDHLSGETNDAL